MRAARHWLLPIVVVFAAVAGSINGAIAHPLWGDEVASARILSEPRIGGVLARVRRTESTPPAWYVLAWAASKADENVTGGKLLAPVERLRLLSVLFAAAASLLTALWAVRLLGDRLLAALAGSLVALGSAPAGYAEQLRAYALLTFVSVSFGWLLVRVASRPGIWSCLGLGLVVWVGALTHYFFFFSLVAGIVWLWASRPRPSGRRAATCAVAVGTFVFLPWLSSFANQAKQGRYAWIGRFDAASVATLPGSLFFGPQGLLYGLARIALTVAVAAGAVVLWRRPGGGAIVALAILPIAGAAVVWSFGRPIFDERNMLVVAPFLAILAAAGLLALPARAVAPLALTALAGVVIGAAYAQLTLGRIEYDRIAAALVDLGWTSKNPIIVDSPRAETSLRVAVGWYLPDHPTLAHVGGRNHCSTSFVVAHSSTFRPWVDKHHGRVVELRYFPSYDHPFRGRANGRILVARLHGTVDPPGELFAVRGTSISCSAKKSTVSDARAGRARGRFPRPTRPAGAA
jgi:hypothetical protein